MSIWHAYLRPIVENMVRTFDDPESTNVKAFWEACISAKELTSHFHKGRIILSGWITAFTYFKEGCRSTFVDTQPNFESRNNLPHIVLDDIP
jgi:hypothetical protein